MKILKNLTLQDIDWPEMGLTIPAESQITLEISDYIKIAKEDSLIELDPYLLSGDIVVNDSVDDLSYTEGKNFLRHPDHARNIRYDDSSSAIVGNNIQDALNSISQGTGIPSVGRVVYVAKNGDDLTANGFFSKPFLTISSAVTYINSNYTLDSENQVIISVQPGTYEESPFILPTYTILSGTSEDTVTIKASNVALDLITLSTGSGIEQCTIENVTTTGKYLIKGENLSGGLLFNNLRLRNCSNGLYLSNTSGTVFFAIRSMRAGGSVTEKLFHFNDNCNGSVFDTVCGGINTFATVGNGSIISFQGARVTSYTLGLDIEEGASVIGTSLDLSQDLDGTPVKKVGSTSICTLTACVYEESKIEIENISNYNAQIFSTEESEQAFKFSEEVNIGTPEQGKELVVGEGDSTIRGMLVYTYNGSSYTDVTDNAKYDDVTTFTFPNTSINSAIYVGCTLDSIELSERYMFNGIKTSMTTASVGGEIVSEYWNGSSWVEFNTMSTQASDNYLSYAKQLFQRTGSEQVRFSYKIKDDWELNDPVSLGLNHRWVRFRIASTLTSAPVFDKWKLRTSSIEINKDGFMEYFGDARPLKALPFTYNSFQAANDSPSNADVYFDDFLGVGRIENEFNTSGLLSSADKVALAEFLPYDIDTSCPVTCYITFATQGSPSGLDQVGFRLYYNKTSNGSRVYETTAQSPSISTGRQEINMTTSVDDNHTQYTTSVELDFSDFIARDSNGEGDLIWLAIVRNDDVDTYNDLVSIINVRFVYTCANEGGHI